MRFLAVLFAASVSMVCAAPPSPDQLNDAQALLLAAQPLPEPPHAPAAPRERRAPLLRPHDGYGDHQGMARRLKRRMDLKRSMIRRGSGILDLPALQKRDADWEAAQLAAKSYNSTKTASASQAFSTAAASSQSSGNSSSVSTGAAKMTGYFPAVSSYYLFALADSDRIKVLDAISGAGFKVIRIFIASVMANNKGSNNAAVNDLEPDSVGNYDDTILEKIDQLMVECAARGLKLNIACSDRYALGFWSTDRYAVELGIVKSGSTGVQMVSNAAAFYTSSSAMTSFDKRLSHILNHQNSLMNNKAWKDLDNVIYAFEPQNEPQGHMTMASSTWMCDRATHMKALLPSNSGISISTGGGITTQDSLGAWATGCDAVDIVSVHDYGTTIGSTVSAIQNAQKGSAAGKQVIMGEWGMSGANKAALIQQFVAGFKAAGISHSYWQVSIPGKKAADFEVWTDEPAWQALTGSSQYFAPSGAAPATTPQAHESAPAWQAASSTAKSAAWTPSPTSSKQAWTPQSSAGGSQAQPSSKGSSGSSGAKSSAAPAATTSAKGGSSGRKSSKSSSSGSGSDSNSGSGSGSK